MQGGVCDTWATQTTAIDIAKQNSEVTVSRGGGGLQGEISGGGLGYNKLGHGIEPHRIM